MVHWLQYWIPTKNTEFISKLIDFSLLKLKFGLHLAIPSVPWDKRIIISFFEKCFTVALVSRVDEKVLWFFLLFQVRLNRFLKYEYDSDIVIGNIIGFKVDVYSCSINVISSVWNEAWFWRKFTISSRFRSTFISSKLNIPFLFFAHPARIYKDRRKFNIGTQMFPRAPTTVLVGISWLGARRFPPRLASPRNTVKRGYSASKGEKREKKKIHPGNRQSCVSRVLSRTFNEPVTYFSQTARRTVSILPIQYFFFHP